MIFYNESCCKLEIKMVQIVLGVSRICLKRTVSEPGSTSKKLNKRRKQNKDNKC